MVYTPISSDMPDTQILQQNTPSSKIPPYEDRGIKYQGYSKQAIASNDYKLNPQQRLTILYNQANSITNETVYTMPEGKKFYCSDLVINFSSVSTVPSEVVIRANTRIVFRALASTNENQIFHFNTPLEFDLNIKSEMQSNDFQIYETFIGWIE